MRTQIHHLVAEAAAARADAPALTFKDVTVSYAQLWREVASFGAALSDLGLGHGDRVAVYLEKRIETVTALFGTSAADGVFVPVNPLLRPEQVGYIMRDCDVRVLVTSPERLALLREELDECKSVEQVVLVGGSPAQADEAGQRYGVSPWRGRRACTLDRYGHRGHRRGHGGHPLHVGQHRPAQGGRAQPPQSHRRGGKREPLSRQRCDDVILSALPLSFDAGFSQLTTAFSVGAHVVLMNYLLPADVVRLCAQHRVTGLTCVPPLWIQIAEQDWPAEAAHAAVLRQHRREDAQGDAG